MRLVSRRAATAGPMAAFAGSVRAGEPLGLQGSLGTAPSHGRNRALRVYLGKPEAGSRGRIKPEPFACEQLHADLNVTRGLRSIKVKQKLRCHALGRWLDDSFNSRFTTRTPLHSLADQDQSAVTLKINPEIVRLTMQDIGGAV
jgi:hypothetical protein